MLHVLVLKIWFVGVQRREVNEADGVLREVRSKYLYVVRGFSRRLSVQDLIKYRPVTLFFFNKWDFRRPVVLGARTSR